MDDKEFIDWYKKYKDENPIMLTSDNGLQLKCKILGLTTISLKKFMRR